MTYTYKLENLDCAHCATKVESAVAKISGVKTCTINFFAQKMKLETENEMTDDFFAIIHKAMRKVEAGVKVTAI